MKKNIYLVRVEGTNFPAIFVDTKRFNRLVDLVAPLNIAVRVLDYFPYGGFISADDLRLFVEITNYLRKL